MLKQDSVLALILAAGLFLNSCQSGKLDLPHQGSTREAITPSRPSCFPIATDEQVPISFAADAKTLVLRSRSGVQFLNLETMKSEIALVSPKPIVAAALSPNGQILAWSLEDNSIQLIQSSNGKLLNTLKGHTDITFKLRFSSNGGRLFSGSHDGSVRIWDSKGDLVQMIQTNGEVLGLGISADGTRLATIPFDGPVELWDLSNYQKISTLGGTGGYDTSDAVFSPDGKYLAADLATGLFLWRLSDGKSLWGEVKNSLAINFSPDGNFLTYADVERNEIVLSTPDGTKILRTLEGMPGTVWELFFSPDSSLLAAADGREIRIWGVEDGQLLYVGKSACPKN